ncbi:unnamed protein product, partial [Choristocarpus tenellus]
WFFISHTHRKGGSEIFVDDLYDWVHVDEKWFYILKDGPGMHLHPTKDPPNLPRAQNKQYTTKVMF